MGNLLTRRRELILASGGSSEWDYEWDYTMGLPTSYGWTRTGSALGDKTKYSLEDEYVKLYVLSNAYNIHLVAPGSNNSVGVLEAVYATSSLSNYQLSYLTFSDGETFGITLRTQYSTNYKGIYLVDGTGMSTNTKLVSLTRNHYYKMRIESDGTNGKVWIDDELKKTFALSEMTSGIRATEVYLTSVSSGNSPSQIMLQSLKLKRQSV